MSNEEVVRNSDKAVAEWTKVVSAAAHPKIKPPEMNTETSHKGNPNNLMSPQQLLQVKPNRTFDSLVNSPPNYNRFSAMPFHPAPQHLQRYRPYDLMQQQQPDGTVNFLSQMEARRWVPIPVRRENPPSRETLAEWASSLQVGDEKRKPLNLKLSLGRF